MDLDRRIVLKGIGVGATIAAVSPLLACSSGASTGADPTLPSRRYRPTDPQWPTPEKWDQLRQQVGGRLIQVVSPVQPCIDNPGSSAARKRLAQMRNPFFIQTQAGGTETSGWANAWMSAISAYAVECASTADVVAAVNFARENNLRLVVKGGGHSYQGGSNCADSLLIWTRGLSDIQLHDAFLPGGAPADAVAPAVSLGAGVKWLQAYSAVTTEAGRYVQGGGCASVGVAGFIQTGGFGNFSKMFGLAAAGLLEAEVVTADGKVVVANEFTNPELFFALKGGGGGTMGVLTKITLRTHDLPDYFGSASMKIQAKSDAAFRTLIGQFVSFYGENLVNEHWGEEVLFGADNSLSVAMVFAGLSAAQVRKIWQPFVATVNAAPTEFQVTTALKIEQYPAQRWWDYQYRMKVNPGSVVKDTEPGAREGAFWWTGNSFEVGIFLYAYHSMWLSQSLLESAEGRQQLVEAMFKATRFNTVQWHTNKGLAGAPPAAIAAAKNTAMNPQVLDSFALVLVVDGGKPAYTGVPGHEPDLATADAAAAKIDKAAAEVMKITKGPGSYVSESNYFQPDWQEAFWGPNYSRLLAAKQQYDPTGLFYVHNGVGSDAWTDNGFTRT